MIDVSDICRMTLEAEDVRSKLNCWKKTCKEKRLALEQNGAWDGKAWETAYDIGKAVEKVDFIMTDLLGEMDKLVEQIKKESK